MNFKIFILSIAISAFSFASCNSGHQESDGHNHGGAAQNTNGSEEAHYEESSVTTLTPDQINSVGINLGAIENKNLTAAIKTNGSLRVPNKNTANVTSLYGGVVKTLAVELGDYVRKGQAIATIENPQFIQLQEEYLTTGSQITLAEQELDRQRELNEGNAGAKRNLQDATSKLNTLRTRKASLHKQIQMMGIDPGNVHDNNLKNSLVVASPINGSVSNVFAKTGSYADASSPIAEIVDNSQLHLDLQVFEKDLPYIKIGQLINFTITNNPTANYTARVYNIGSSFQNASKTIAVHSTIEGNKKGLIDGMNITALVSIGNVSTPAVPNEAIVEADGKFYIFVTDKAINHNHTEDDDPGNKKTPAHNPGNKHEHVAENQLHKGEVRFEKIEIAKGVSHLGYTAITPVKELSPNVKVVTKGAFFINAKMSDPGGHEH